jgi:hypothetical protein
MTKMILSLILIFFALCFSVLSGQESAPRRHDFSDGNILKKEWHLRGKQFGVPLTRFYVKKSDSACDRQVLVLETNSSSGVIITRVPPEVWQKYPVMRWRWRILKKVSFSQKELDDQAAVIYFGDGTTLRQNMMGYSWESLSALENVSKLQYGMGTRNVYRICMRNKNAELSKWYEEERNVVEDFKKAFGRMPKGLCALTIGANSQYSKSKTLVEIDFVEFCEKKKGVASSEEQHVNIAERRIEK